MALLAAPLALLPLPPAAAAPGDPVVVLQSGVNGCNGVRPTPGSENTHKTLDPDFPSDFNPGGVVGYIIDYPVDATDVSGRTTFVITDCVFVNGVAIAKYSVSFVPNTVDYKLQFSVPIPAGTLLGAQFCNYAKTTAAPSESQASNRKAGPACFTVGGGLRIEKRTGSSTGPLLAGASFSVVCRPTVLQPPTIITGLSGTSHTNLDGSVSASGVSATGTIAIVGPSGTPCTVTETAAPAGYQLDPTPRNLVIPVGTSQTINVFVNLQLGGLIISKITTGGTGTFTFHVNCDPEGFDQDVEITDTDSVEISNIPVGTSCTVTEEGDSLFTSVLVSASNTVIIDVDGETVSFTNTRKTGDLIISKTTTGGTGTFTFHVNCDPEGFDQDVQITDTDSVTISDIPTGTSCTVTEEPDLLFNSSPASGTVTIDVGGETVSFTNTRKTGDLIISKTTTGGTGTFTFHVNCDPEGFDRDVQITDTDSVTISGIPTGTSCTVTEEADLLFNSSPASGTVTIDVDGETVSFTNTRKTGDLVISKTAIGGIGTFTFDVDCSDDAFDQVVSIEDGTSETITGIPTTTTCTVTERSDPLFTSSVLPVNGTVIIDVDGESVAFVNTAKTNGIVLDKKVNGADHATAGDALPVHAGDSVTYTVVITNNGLVPVTITALSDSLYAGLIAACPQGIGSVLAVGASFTCTYTVGAVGDANNVASVTVVDGLGRTLTDRDGTYVDVLNPAITIVKTANPVSVSVSGPVTYTYVVTNTGDAVLSNIVVTDDIIGPIGTVASLAPGESVTLSKTVNVDASTPPTNIGTANGTDVLGKTVTASDSETIAVVLGIVVVAPAAQPAVQPAAELPRTGSPLGSQARLGLFLLQAGLVLALLGHRRRKLHLQTD